MVRRSSAHSRGGGWNSHTAMRRNIDVRHVVNIHHMSHVSRQKAKSADAADDLHYPNRYICLMLWSGPPRPCWLPVSPNVCKTPRNRLATPVLKATKILLAVKVLGSWEFAHERCEKNTYYEVAYSCIFQIYWKKNGIVLVESVSDTLMILSICWLLVTDYMSTDRHITIWSSHTLGSPLYSSCFQRSPPKSKLLQVSVLPTDTVSHRFSTSKPQKAWTEAYFSSAISNPRHGKLLQFTTNNQQQPTTTTKNKQQPTTRDPFCAEVHQRHFPGRMGRATPWAFVGSRDKWTQGAGEWNRVSSLPKIKFSDVFCMTLECLEWTFGYVFLWLLKVYDWILYVYLHTETYTHIILYIYLCHISMVLYGPV